MFPLLNKAWVVFKSYSMIAAKDLMIAPKAFIVKAYSARYSA